MLHHRHQHQHQHLRVPFTVSFVTPHLDVYKLVRVTIGFRTLNWTSRETYKSGEINSVETTRLARKENRHDFLLHGDLLRASLYGLQG